MRPAERTVTVGGLRTRYMEAKPSRGRRTVVFVHGFAGRAEQWGPNLAALGERHRVVAPDLLGHGATAKPPHEDYSMRGYARFLLRFLDALDIDRCALVGSSMGGLVAGLVAAQAPRRVAALALVSTAGLGRLDPTAQARYVRYFFETSLFGPSEERLRRFWAENIYHNEAKIPRVAVRRGLDLWGDPEARRSLRRTARALYTAGRTLRPVLPGLDVPKAFFWGANDPQFPVAYARDAHRENPGSDLVVFESCGHLPNLEAAEGFNRALRAFLQRAWGDGDAADAA